MTSCNSNETFIITHLVMGFEFGLFVNVKYRLWMRCFVRKVKQRMGAC